MRKFLSAIALLACSFSLVAAQPSITPEKALARVLQQTPPQAGWFAPNFLAQIPMAQVDAIVKQYTGAIGAFQRADATADGFTLVMERGTAPAKIHLDTEGRIDGLWFGPPQPTKPMSLEDGMKEFSGLPGRYIRRPTGS